MSNETWCKMCGIASATDAVAAEQAGSNAIGINFYAGSPRCVDLATAQAVAGAVSITRVGLFVDPEPDAVWRVLDACDLDMLQFHGNESPAFCEQFDRPFIKVARIKADTAPQTFAESYGAAWGLLFDTYVDGVPGGTGRTFDWSQWPTIEGRRLILAGGLTVNNVAEAVIRLRPFGVDVSGGVEGNVKGRKDARLMQDFLKEVRRGERQ